MFGKKKSTHVKNKIKDGVIASQSNHKKINPTIVIFGLSACLFIGSLVFFFVAKSNKPVRTANYTIVCDTDTSSQYDNLLDVFAASGYPADETNEYRAFMKKIIDNQAAKQDPTCLYMMADFYLQTNNPDKASFLVADLEKLYNQNMLADSRSLTVSSLPQLKEKIRYAKSMGAQAAIESSPSYENIQQ